MTKKNKYAYENLPLSTKTKDGVNSGVFIDVLSALGTMMTLQDDAYEEIFTEIKDKLIDIKDSQDEGLAEIRTRLTSIELRLDSIEADQKKLHKKDGELEQHIKILEQRLEELKSQLSLLKQEFEEHKSE